MKVLDWWEALCICIEDHRDSPLVWGKWDCCQFTAACIQAMTGVDYLTAFPKYESEREALEIIAGFGSIQALMSSVLGEAKPVAFAKRGDVVAIDAGAGVAAGVCLGVMCAVMGAQGMQFRPCAEATAAWSID